MCIQIDTALMTKRSRIHETNIKRGISKMGSRNQCGKNTISICKCEDTKGMKLDNNGMITICEVQQVTKSFNVSLWSSEKGKEK